MTREKKKEEKDIPGTRRGEEKRRERVYDERERERCLWFFQKIKREEEEMHVCYKIRDSGLLILVFFIDDFTEE